MVKRSSSKKKQNYESLAPACDTTFDLISTFFPANLIDGFQSRMIRTFLDLNRFLKSDKDPRIPFHLFEKFSTAVNSGIGAEVKKFIWRQGIQKVLKCLEAIHFA
jgi:hypothetical protein